MRRKAISSSVWLSESWLKRMVQYQRASGMKGTARRSSTTNGSGTEEEPTSEERLHHRREALSSLQLG